MGLNCNCWGSGNYLIEARPNPEGPKIEAELAEIGGGVLWEG